MELPNVGGNCAEPSCKRLDFLPLVCVCSKKFCSEHFGKHAYDCFAIQSVNSEKSQPSTIYMCSNSNCNKTSLVPIICEKCSKNFCIEHRHIINCEEEDPVKRTADLQKFQAPIQQFNEAKSRVDEQILEQINEAKKKNKNAGTANKLHLMLIKNKAVGMKIIPSCDRIYFNIACPKQSESKLYPIFVSKTWSVGHIIDFIANELKLANSNNKNALKLRLFRKDSRKIISVNVSSTLQNLLDSGDVYNGEELILEYVGADCIKI